MNLYTKWSLIVFFNAIFCLIFAYDYMISIPNVLGMIAGIIFFVIIYVEINKYLLNTSKKIWLKSLVVATVIMAITSLAPLMPIIAGSFAFEVTGAIFHLPSSGFNHDGFFPLFLTTIFTGIFLSLVVLTLAIIINLMFIKYPKLARIDDDSD